VLTRNRTTFLAGGVVVVVVVFLFATCLNGFITWPSVLELPSSFTALPDNGRSIMGGEEQEHTTRINLEWGEGAKESSEMLFEGVRGSGKFE